MNPMRSANLGRARAERFFLSWMCLSLSDFKQPRTPPPTHTINRQSMGSLDTFEYFPLFLRCINGFKRSIEISSDWATANRCVLVVCPFAGFIVILRFDEA